MVCFINTVIIGLLFIFNVNFVYAEEIKTNSIQALSITTLAIPNNNNTSEVGNALGQAQNQFGSDDIALTHGALMFTESDLTLQGLNGMNVVVARSYNSTLYKSDPAVDVTKAKAWGGWAGHGWSFSFAQRAFWVECPNDYNYQRVIVDNGGSLDSYKYNSGTYKSILPANTNKVYFEPTGLKRLCFQNDNGLVYIFALQFYTESYKYMVNGIPQGIFNIKGYYLTEIKDLYGNSISIGYESITPTTISTDVAKMSYVVGDAYKFLMDKTIDTMSATITNYRAQSIADNLFNRIAYITYNDSDLGTLRNQCVANKDYMVTGVNYKNVNNGTNYIKYKYDVNGNMTSVQLNDMPAKTYGYYQYTPSFANYSSGNNRKTFFPDEASGWGYDSSCPEYNGYILNSVVTQLGSGVSYNYQECLVRQDPTVNAGITYEKSLEHGTYPIVTGKTVKEDGTQGQVLNYTYQYPMSNLSHPQKTGYIPPNSVSGVKLYCFSGVTVNNPEGLEQDSYAFENAHLTLHKNGTIQTITAWNHSLNQQTSVIIKKGTIVQSKKTFDTYDQYNNLTKATVYDGDSTLFRTETFTYDSYSGNNLFHLLHSEIIAGSGKSKNYTYSNNDKGKVTGIYEGTNQLKSISYDSKGRTDTEVIMGETYAKNLTIKYAYTDDLASNYRVEKTTNYGNANAKTTKLNYYRNTGTLKNTVDESGQVTAYTYDDYGRVTAISYPVGSESYSYPNLQKVTNTVGMRSVSTYLDNFGRVIFIENPFGEENIRYVYKYGDKISGVYRSSSVTKTNYSSYLKKSTYYDSYLRPSTVSQTGWGSIGYQYDLGNGNDISITETKGLSVRTYTQKYDKLGRMYEETYNGNTKKYTYDAFSNPLSVRDANSKYMSSAYDNYGRLTYTSHPGSSIVVPADTSYWTKNTYAKGLLRYKYIKNEDQSGLKTYEFVYDNEGRITNTLYNNSNIEWYYYDETGYDYYKGKATRAKNAMCESKYNYDSMGRIHYEAKLFQSKQYSSKVEYTSKGQVESVVYGRSSDTYGKTLSSTDYNISYEYDSQSDRLTKIKRNGSDIASYYYNSNGTVGHIVYGNGLTTWYTYDGTREILVASMNIVKDSNYVYKQGITYDDQGNIKALTHTDLFQTDDKSMTNIFGYNANDELTTVKKNGVDSYYVFAYDNNNNRKKFDSPKAITSQDWDINKYNRIETMYSSPGNYNFYNYDNLGNMTSKQMYRSAHHVNDNTYSYNYNNSLINVSDWRGSIATFNYDIAGQRVYAEVNEDGQNKKKIYHWDSLGNLIGEGTTVQDFTIKYIYAGNQKIAMVRVDAQGNETLYYFINDLQGTPVIITDEQAKIVHRQQTDAYGNLEMFVSIFPDEVNYTGKKLDKATGLYYFNQRYYDPNLGRFITNDPAGQSLNPYQYCANNPLLYTDPDGQFFLEIGTWLCPGLGTLIGGMLDAGAVAAGVNAGSQLLTKGKIDWQSVGNSFAQGALSAGLSYGVGELGNAIGMGKDIGFKTIAHGISGGIQSMASGGSFGSGFAGGAISNIACFASAGIENDMDRMGIAGLAGGATSALTGGSFAQGFQSGAFQYMYNDKLHDLVSKGEMAANQAEMEADKKYPGMEKVDTVRDAYRHMRWNELMAQRCGRGFALLAGWQHELAGFDSISKVFSTSHWKSTLMDLNNNAAGRTGKGSVYWLK